MQPAFMRLSASPIDADANAFGTALRLLLLTQQHHDWSFEELRFRTEQELKRLEEMVQQQERKQLSRREMLAFLAELPIAMFGLADSTLALPAEEALPLYVTAVPACWRLYFSGEIAEVGRVLPAYILQLMPLAQCSSRYQQTAASLLSQAY